MHAYKTSHKERLEYTRPPKEKSYYIKFEDKKHLYINWVDEPTGKYFKVETFIEAMNFIDKFISQNKKIFIHCDQGQSRSPALAMTYLAKRTDFLGDEFDQAYNGFKQIYPNFNPSGIIKFIENNWEEIK